MMFAVMRMMNTVMMQLMQTVNANKFSDRWSSLCARSKANTENGNG